MNAKSLFIFLLFSCSLIHAQVANRYDVIIHEIFPDPSPVIALPTSEFIELKNISASAFNLKDWKLSDGTSTATINTNFFLQPDSFVIICTNAAVAAYSVFGPTIGVTNFPSLDNDGDVIFLQSKEGKTIHAVEYNKTWYQNDVKSDGGWTLEMIDSKNFCSGYSNWKAGTDAKGGTPGRQNSIQRNNKDDMPPALLRTYTIDSITIVAVFDEPLDSNTAAVNTAYVLDKGIGAPISAIPRAPLFTQVILKFSSKISNALVYNLTINSSVKDCAGNSVGIKNKSKAGLPQLADSSDIVINELLFNPKPDGYDYVEVYNRSNKVTDLKQLLIASRNAAGALTSIKPMATASYLFFPGEYLLLTENSRWVQQNYVVKNAESIVELPSLPSMPDDKGTIVLTNVQGKIIDELRYDEKWHFALIANNEAVSLERIDYNQPTQNKSNWTSAASTAGFGTPGYQNSQFKADQQVQGTINILPKIFSPDNDGFEDFATIQYQMTEPGYVANITIFDANGRPVRYLAKNATLGLSGNFRWDGLDEKMRKLPVGIYLVFTEIFNLNGKTKKFKNAITLARRLQ